MLLDVVVGFGFVGSVGVCSVIGSVVVGSRSVVVGSRFIVGSGSVVVGSVVIVVGSIVFGSLLLDPLT